MTQIKESVYYKLLECETTRTSIEDKFIPVTSEDSKKWKRNLKKEIIYWGQYDIGVTEITKEYAKNNADEIFEKYEIFNNLYYLDKETAGGKEKTYIYDKKADIVYKVPSTRIGRHKVHSIEELNDVKGIILTEDLITNQSEMVTVNEISYYEPDLSGFALNRTSIVYYEKGSETIENSITVPAQEYLNGGKQRIIEKDGKTYEFYNYKEQIWGNILVENNNMQS